MEVQVKKLEDLCSYLCKFVLYNYEFYMEHSNIIISESIVKSVCEIVELQPPQSFFTESLILIELCKQKILDEIKNYQVRFGGLNNIFKFTKK